MRKETKARITLAAVLFMAAFMFGPISVVALELDDEVMIPTEIVFILIGVILSILYVGIFGIGSFDGIGSRNRWKMGNSLTGIWSYVRGYKYNRIFAREGSGVKGRKVKVPTRGRGASTGMFSKGKNTWQTGGWKEGKWNTGEGKWPTGKMKSKKKK